MIRRAVAPVATAVTAALLVPLALGLPAAAQEPDPATSTTSSTTTTTAPPPPPPSPPPPPPPSPPTTAPIAPPPHDPAAHGDAPVEAVPVVPETVPPAEGGPTSALDRQASRLIRGELRAARVSAAETAAVHRLARERIAHLEAELVRLEQEMQSLRAEHRAAIERLVVAREVLERRAVSAYVRGNSGELSVILEARDPNDLQRRSALVRSVLDADDRSVQDYLDARDALSADLVQTADDVTAARQELEAARVIAEQAAIDAQSAEFTLAAFAAGSEIAISGFTFPVGDPHSFTDSFGAPRMTGTEYEHWHEGTDIFAPRGTPVVAAERGLVTRMGTDTLGGIKVWLKGESGTYYYYAHLSGYAPGMAEGAVVEAGAELGYVGTTGNAVGTPPHLHFEIHPDGGQAVNPYPLLKVVDELRKAEQGSPDSGR